MTKIKQNVEIVVSGTALADWWWELDSDEQAEFFARLEEIKQQHPVSFHMQLQFLREALQRVFAVDGSLPEASS